MILPARPVAAVLNGGFVQVVPVPTPPGPRPPRATGDSLLPGASEIEQDLVWVMPHLLRDWPITPAAVHRVTSTSWDWAVGAACHRAIIEGVVPDRRHLNTEAGRQAVAAARKRVRDTVRTYKKLDDASAGLLAVQLDLQADAFGASDKTNFQLITWAQRAEFRLAQEMGDSGWRVTTQDRARYGSFSDLLKLDDEQFASRAGNLIDHYMAHAFDIAASWRGAPSEAELAREIQRRARNDRVMRGFGSYLSSRSDAAERRKKNQDRELRNEYLKAKTRYLDK